MCQHRSGHSLVSLEWRKDRMPMVIFGLTVNSSCDFYPALDMRQENTFVDLQSLGLTKFLHRLEPELFSSFFFTRANDCGFVLWASVIQWDFFLFFWLPLPLAPVPLFNSLALLGHITPETDSAHVPFKLPVFTFGQAIVTGNLFFRFAWISAYC